MLPSLPGLLCFLIFAPRCALSLFQFVAYSARVNQCGPFNVSFSGGSPPAALPLTLTVIPFDSTPLAFTIPDSAWDNSTGSVSYATLLPLPAGIAFMASVDDAEGNSAASVSGIIQVEPSTDTSCLPSKTAAPAPFRLLSSTVTQCFPFSVSLNTSSLDQSLSTRVFIPMGLTSKLRLEASRKSQTVETFTFIMSVVGGYYIALLFDDGKGNRQVSDLLLVGDGPSGCLHSSSASPTAVAPARSQSISRSAIFAISGFYLANLFHIRAAVIAISVSSTLAVLIVVILGILFLRRERRKLIEGLGGAVQNRRSVPRSLRLGPSPLATPKPARASIPGMVPHSPAPVDPVYPQEMFVISSTESRRARQSSRSTILAPFSPTRSLRSMKSRSSTKSRSASTRTKSSTKGNRHFADLDIAGLLEAASEQMAATESPYGYPSASPHTVTPAHTPLTPPSPSPSSPGAGNRLPDRLSHHDPDVPLSPTSRYSQEWFPLEPPSVPAVAATVVSPRNGLSSRIMPPRAPFPSPSIFAPSQKMV